MKKEPACREPSVQHCLSCTRKECDVVTGVPLHRSEIIAEINAGMLSLHALMQHDARQGKLRKHTDHSRSDAEVCERDESQ
jgi:hypothetical protein